MTPANHGIYPAAFFLYAETYLPDETARADTLRALQRCADGTARATPDVATYVFRPSALTQRIGEQTYPGCLALESTELYLTPGSFRDHLTTPEFREGLRAMYRGAKRLGARIFWIGAHPESDMLHNIFRSDPVARPIAPLVADLFDDDVAAQSARENFAIISLAATVSPGDGAKAIDAVLALRRSLSVASFVAFFHPLATDVLRIFSVLPLGTHADATRLAASLEAFAAPSCGVTSLAGQVCGPGAPADARLSTLSSAWARFASADTFQIVPYSGYVLHPSLCAHTR